MISFAFDTSSGVAFEPFTEDSLPIAMASLPSSEKGSEDSACAELPESDTPGPSSTSVGSEIKPQKEFFVHKVALLRR